MNNAQTNVVILGERDVFVKNGQPICTSLAVAARFGRRHADVLNTIQNIECSKEFGQRNFSLSSYISEQAKELPMYTMLFIAAAAVVIAACADIGFARQERYERAAMEWEAR